MLRILHSVGKSKIACSYILPKKICMDIQYILDLMRESILKLIFVNIWALGISFSAGMIARYFWDLLYPIKQKQNGSKQ